MVNPNWARWIFASVAYELKEVNSGIPAIVEGLDERDSEFLNAPNRAEIRVTGPEFQYQQGQYRAWVNTNVMLTNYMGDETVSRHELHRLAGLYLERLSKPIEVWNYGNQPGDFQESQTFIGCLVPRRGKSDMTKLFYFGQVEKDDRVRQALADARYEMYLDT